MPLSWNRYGKSRVRLVKITKQRLLSFDVDVEAPAGVIGTGTHQRLVVERSRFVRS